jgi:gliding motility-associated lipoprotein GldH
VKRLIIICLLFAASSCGNWDTLRVYEKNIEIPGTFWDYHFIPSFEAYLTDTASYYNLYVTIRHTDAYRYSNLWLLITSQYPGQAAKTSRVELPLADQDGKWLGSGMDDIFSQRAPILQNASFHASGLYRFSLVQDMRQNPLPHVMSIGFRVEKAGRHQP